MRISANRPGALPPLIVCGYAWGGMKMGELRVGGISCGALKTIPPVKRQDDFLNILQPVSYQVGEFAHNRGFDKE